MGDVFSFVERTRTQLISVYVSSPKSVPAICEVLIRETGSVNYFLCMWGGESFLQSTLTITGLISHKACTRVQ